jgi:hypothetical protein
LNAARRQYERHEKKGYPDYFKKGEGVQRNLRKTDARFIIWVAADLPDDNIRKIESRLINLYRPAFNARRPNISKEEIFTYPLMKCVDNAIEGQIGRMSGDFTILKSSFEASAAG